MKIYCGPQNLRAQLLEHPLPSTLLNAAPRCPFPTSPTVFNADVMYSKLIRFAVAQLLIDFTCLTLPTTTTTTTTTTSTTAATAAANSSNRSTLWTIKKVAVHL